jgi:aminoglycoside 6'-N-acetyltransferase
MQSDVTFQPLQRHHKPLLVNWTAQPHVKEWWSEADENVDSFFDPGDHAPYIAFVALEAMAYIQSYPPSRLPDHAWQNALPQSARGIDLFIGPPNKIDQGLGTTIIRSFTAKLFAEGATQVVIDPDRRNSRAIAAYVKAGFTPYDEYDGDLLMQLLPEDFDYGSGYEQN